MVNWEQLSDELHRSKRGKIRITSAVSLESNDDLSTAYTPGVASPTKRIAEDEDKAFEYTSKERNVAIVTNGTAVLGLGDVGASASIPVMEGKAAILKRFADIDGYPVPVDDDTPSGVIHVAKSIAPYYNGVNLEDIKAPECFVVHDKLSEELDIPVFHDDQHGTAIVVLAALANAKALRPFDFDDKIVINGAGAAGLATADLLLHAGYTNITVLDSKGILAPSRRDMNEYKERLAERVNPEDNVGDLSHAVRDAAVFIGVSVGGIVTEDHVERMQDDPVVFALANPEPEIHPEKAQRAGASIIATGRSDYPNQVNNALVFPGLFNGLIRAGKRNVDLDDMVNVARGIAGTIEPETDRILPDVFNEDVVESVTNALA